MKPEAVAVTVLGALLAWHATDIGAQTRADTVAVVAAALWTFAGDTMYVAPGAPEVLVEAARSMGATVLRPDRPLVCAGGVAEPDDVVGSILSISLRPPPTVDVGIDPRTGDTLWATMVDRGFSIGEGRAQVPISRGCAIRVGQDVRPFGTGATILLERVDGKWLVTGEAGRWIT